MSKCVTETVHPSSFCRPQARVLIGTICSSVLSLFRVINLKIKVHNYETPANEDISSSNGLYKNNRTVCAISLMFDIHCNTKSCETTTMYQSKCRKYCTFNGVPYSHSLSHWAYHVEQMSLVVS